jgi:CBS domain containing-hemolysin-like protein
MSPDIILVLVSLVASAFFSGMEIAYLASNRLKIEVEKKQGTLRSKIISVFYNNESSMIALLLLGNNVALVVYGMAAAEILNPIIDHSWGIHNEGYRLVLQTLISTLLVLVTAEFLPKAVVQINPNRFLNIGSFPMLLIFIILYIPTQIVLFISSSILRLFGAKHENTDKVFSRVDLEHYVDDLASRMKSEEEISKDMHILRNALDFSNIKARDCMIPRTEMIAVDIEDEIHDLKSLFIERGLSKIIIYRDSIDNVIGYVHSFELFKNPNSIKQILKPIPFVTEVIPGKELLEKFTSERSNLAIVTDEYGGTAGLVTLEDVIEEIFGEIEDEHDKDDWIEEKISENEYLFSARVEIDYLNETFGLKLDESDQYETLAGLIIHQLETIPEKGRTLEFNGYTITIEEVSDRKIEKVRIIKSL